MLQYIAGRGGGPLVRLWQVRPPPSPALPLRTAFLRRFCRTHGRAPYSYFQPLILSRPTQTILVCATSVATHALARTRAHAQNQTLTVQVSVHKLSCPVTGLSRLSAPGSNASRFAMAWPWKIFGLQTDCSGQEELFVHPTQAQGCRRPKMHQRTMLRAACPGTQKNLDPEHPLARDSRGSLALRSFYILV